METLRHELKLVADASPKGSHKKVADKIGYSEMYLQQIRSGKTLTNDTPGNRKLIKDFIKEYRRLIRNEIRKLQKL